LLRLMKNAMKEAMREAVREACEREAYEREVSGEKLVDIFCY